MGLRESMMAVIVRHKLLANQIPKGCATPLEEWIAIKTRKTFKKSDELRAAIGKDTLKAGFDDGIGILT